MRSVTLLLAALALAGCATSDPQPPAASPSVSAYAGQETREIKALSASEIDGYRAGAGLGYAKSAELNHYPGPLHALELADDIGLTQAQRADLQRLREDMLAEAIPLGEAYLTAEAEIEAAFRSGDVDAQTLRGLLERAADVEAQLRFVHLDAHLTTRALMTPEQVAKYDELRGYSMGDDASADHAHAHG